MGELISQLMSPQLTVAVVLVVAMFAVLYVLSIIWVSRDAFLRNANWKKWTLVAIIPIGGIIAYCLLRPPLLQIDKDEQELEIAIKQRELLKYGECSRCGYPVESTYVICPNCHQRLKNLCPTCHHALEPEWSVCPYCMTIIQNDGIPPRQAAPRQMSAGGQRSLNAPDARRSQMGDARTRKPRNAAQNRGGAEMSIPDKRSRR